jgi:hypothetical protein
MLLGCCVMLFGLMHSVPELSALVFYVFLAAFYACFLPVAIILHRGSARTAETKLVPIRDELAGLVRSLDDSVSESAL